MIDGTGSPAVARDLRIEGGRIVALAPAGTLIGEVGDSILDASGRTVLPGFIDAHKHIFEPDSPELLGVLYFGTTTIRDAGSSLAPAAGLRDRILSGARPGPRIVYAGPMFYGEELPELMGLTDQFNQFIAEAEEISRGLAIAKGMGAEFVKHYGYSNWSEMVRTIEEAHRMGLRISGHCTSVLPAVAAGADGHEHGAQCSRNLARVRQDYARLDVAAGMWATVSPALMLVDLLEHDDPQYRERPPLRSFVRGTSIAYRSPREAWLSRYLRWRSLTTTLYEEGVLLASGTDHYMPNATQINLQGLVEAGLTPLEAIAAVTSQAARVVGAEQDLGTVQIGKIADLVVLDADPTTDIRNAGLVWQVIQGGRIVDRESLVEQAEEESSGNN